MAENNSDSQSQNAVAPGGAQPGMSQGNPLNERTYQEVDYLKKNLGPILVAALAEICIRRPADPIEYLGHWLLRWRYNEELKRRDVQNALEVVRRKTWNDGERQSDPLQDAGAQNVPSAPETFTEGFIPANPYGPPGYGGPLSSEQVKSVASPEAVAAAETSEAQIPSDPSGVAEPESDEPPAVASGAIPSASVTAAASVPAAASASTSEQPKRVSVGGEPKRASMGGEPKRASLGGDTRRSSTGGETKRASLGGEEPKRPSLVPEEAPAADE